MGRWPCQLVRNFIGQQYVGIPSFALCTVERAQVFIVHSLSRKSLGKNVKIDRRNKK